MARRTYCVLGKTDGQPSVPDSLWTFIWTGLTALAVWYLGFRENDTPIRYKVPSPKRPEKVEILDEPSIKVRIALRLPRVHMADTPAWHTGPRLHRSPVLCPRDGPVPRPREPVDDKRH